MVLLNKEYDEWEIPMSKFTAADDALQQLVPSPVSPPISPPPFYTSGPREKIPPIRRRSTLEGDATDMTEIQEPVRPSSIPPVSTIYCTIHETVPGLVEILFDLLPALRAARETYCSRPVEAEILEDNAPAALRTT